MKQIYHDLLQNHQAKLPHNQGQFQHWFSGQFHPEVKNSWNSLTNIMQKVCCIYQEPILSLSP